MEVHSNMLVPESYKDTEADVQRCPQCKGNSFHVPVYRLVFTPGGARTLRLWSCEVHPLPEEGLVAR